MLKKALFIFFWLLFVPQLVWAENFEITNYDVQLKVEKDKTTTVVERIKVFFHVPSHGIFRKIPIRLRDHIFLDYVSENYQVSYEDGSYTIKIGNPNALVEGEHEYAIVYVHTMRGSPREFYYNLIGEQWPVNIHRATFSVDFPEDIDASMVGLSIGRYGTKGFDGGAKYSVENNRVVGYTEQPLSSYEGITLRVEVPEGFFVLSPDKAPVYTACGLAFLTLVCIIVWFFIGRDEKVIPVVNFYPPKNFNGAEFEVLYQGKASFKGLVALVLYLADAGYLKIEQKSGDYILQKIKDYDGIDLTTAEFMDILFKGGERVPLSELQCSETFYKNCRNFIQEFNRLRPNIFHENSIGLFYRFILGIAIVGILGFNLFILTGFDASDLKTYGALTIFPTIAVIVWMMNYKKSLLHYTIWAFVYGGIPLLQMLRGTSFEFLNDKGYACLMLFGLVCLFVSAVCLYQLPKRNKFGRRLLGEIEGFKKFLETAEAPKVKALAEQDQSYASHVLPYLYLFGLSTAWMTKFSGLFSQKPVWFEGNFTAYSFSNFSGMMEKSVIPTVSNGGISRSSGGGGFAGGGHGGGGGGSW